MTDTSPYTRSLPHRLCRRGAALLNLQCWLWGQDIRRADGNLLLQYGANRLRPPKDVTGCSQYSFALADGIASRKSMTHAGSSTRSSHTIGKDGPTSVTALKLWGFGIYIGSYSSPQPGGANYGCYLNRYEFVPRLADGNDCWNAESLRSAPRNPPLHAIPAALRWIAAYERWVLHEIGTAWRLASSAAGPDSTGTALHLAAHWSNLARDIERWSKQRTLKPLSTPALVAA